MVHSRAHGVRRSEYMRCWRPSTDAKSVGAGHAIAKENDADIFALIGLTRSVNRLSDAPSAEPVQPESGTVYQSGRYLVRTSRFSSSSIRAQLDFCPRAVPSASAHFGEFQHEPHGAAVLDADLTRTCRE